MANKRRRNFGEPYAKHRTNAASAVKQARRHARDVREYLAGKNCAQAIKAFARFATLTGYIEADRLSLGKAHRAGYKGIATTKTRKALTSKIIAFCAR